MSVQNIDIFGYIGGIILAICHLPQIHKMWETRSADDLSYSSLAFYLTGLILLFIYMVGIGALAGWICMILEIFLCVFVIGLKFALTFDYFKLKPSSEMEFMEKSVPESALEFTFEENKQ